MPTGARQPRCHPWPGAGAARRSAVCRPGHSPEAHSPGGPIAAGCCRAAGDQRHVGAASSEESIGSSAPAAHWWGLRPSTDFRAALRRCQGVGRRSLHAARLGKGFTSQPGWTLGFAALRHRGGAGPCRAARGQGGSCVSTPVAVHPSHRAALSFPSGNAKTGPIAVLSSSWQTCPSFCPLAGDQGCYAEAPAAPAGAGLPSSVGGLVIHPISRWSRPIRPPSGIRLQRS
jgi:hypothetical protein